MIELKSRQMPADLEESTAGFTYSDYLRIQRELRQAREILERRDLEHGTFSIEKAVGSDGLEYDNITIKIEGYFKRDGDDYVFGGGFVVNVSTIFAMANDWVDSHL